MIWKFKVSMMTKPLARDRNCYHFCSIIVSFHCKIGGIWRNGRQSQTVACRVVVFPPVTTKWDCQGAAALQSQIHLLGEITGAGSLQFDTNGEGKGRGGCGRDRGLLLEYVMYLLFLPNGGVFECHSRSVSMFRYWHFCSSPTLSAGQRGLIAG